MEPVLPTLNPGNYFQSVVDAARIVRNRQAVMQFLKKKKHQAYKELEAIEIEVDKD